MASVQHIFGTAVPASEQSNLDFCGLTPSTSEIPAGFDIRLNVHRARRLRVLRKELFGDLYTGPAWDILLHLFESYVFQRRDTVGTVRDGVDLPLTTTVRWIDRLVVEGLISTHTDHLDARRRFVELCGPGVDLMTKYFSGAAPHLIAA